MAYDRINWENAPSTETPLSAENLNTMDAKIAALDAQAEELSEKHNQLEDSVELLDQRMDTFASLPAGTTAGNAELIEARTINGQAYNTLHNALDGEFSGVKTDISSINTEIIKIANISGQPSIKAGTGYASIAEGVNNSASGDSSHAEGSNTTASGDRSHAEGSGSIASGASSHAEGASNASGNWSHAEGGSTKALAPYAHAEGNETKASGYYGSHAEGFMTEASGDSSHAEGTYTKATHKSQHVFGAYNEEDPNSSGSGSRGTYIEIVGNGNANNNRSNARTLDWEGNEVLAGDLTINGTQSVGDGLSSLQTALTNKITIEGTKMVIHA